MIYNKFIDREISRLGMGCMRLPVGEDGRINEELTEKMVDLAMKSGINYFDTAYPYHGGESERVIGRCLSKYPRESYALANKYPGHQVLESYDPAVIFEEQLEKCGVEYFDYYLLHNVNEKSIGVYKNEEYGILEYFLRQKELGRIRHLGFSTHGALPNFKEFLDYAGDKMEFCQIQLNYLDWTMQDAKTKYEMLTEMNIPVVVMEPLRGGKLATADLGEEYRGRSASLALRFVADLPGVKVILSGMSNMEQLQDNISTFENEAPLTDAEREMLLSAAEGMKKDVPCTACRYCTEGCPAHLDIPMLLEAYVEASYVPSLMLGIRLESLEADKKHPKNCIGCKKCEKMCPQNIKISALMAEFAEIAARIPRWDDVCRERAAAAKKRK